MTEKEVELLIRTIVDEVMKRTMVEVIPILFELHQAKCPHGHKVNRLKWAMIGGAVAITVMVPAYRPILTFFGGI